MQQASTIATGRHDHEITRSCDPSPAEANLTSGPTDFRSRTTNSSGPAGIAKARRGTETTRPAGRRPKMKWTEAESNRRHQDFQSCALPAELSVPFLFAPARGRPNWCKLGSLRGLAAASTRRRRLPAGSQGNQLSSRVMTGKTPAHVTTCRSVRHKESPGVATPGPSQFDSKSQTAQTVISGTTYGLRYSRLNRWLAASLPMNFSALPSIWSCSPRVRIG
jgi:hypothetical protein